MPSNVEMSDQEARNKYLGRLCVWWPAPGREDFVAYIPGHAPPGTPLRLCKGDTIVPYFVSRFRIQYWVDQNIGDYNFLHLADIRLPEEF